MLIWIKYWNRLFGKFKKKISSVTEWLGSGKVMMLPVVKMLGQLPQLGSTGHPKFSEGKVVTCSGTVVQFFLRIAVSGKRVHSDWGGGIVAFLPSFAVCASTVLGFWLNINAQQSGRSFQIPLLFIDYSRSQSSDAQHRIRRIRILFRRQSAGAQIGYEHGLWDIVHLQSIALAFVMRVNVNYVFHYVFSWSISSRVGVLHYELVHGILHVYTFLGGTLQLSSLWPVHCAVAWCRSDGPRRTCENDRHIQTHVIGGHCLDPFLGTFRFASIDPGISWLCTGRLYISLLLLLCRFFRRLCFWCAFLRGSFPRSILPFGRVPILINDQSWWNCWTIRIASLFRDIFKSAG